MSEGYDIYPETLEGEYPTPTPMEDSPSVGDPGAQGDASHVPHLSETGADPLRTSVDFPCLPWGKKDDSSQGASKSEELSTDKLPTVNLSDTYNTGHKRRGYAVIFNQERFDYRMRLQGYTDRDGSKVDGQNVKKTLRDLGFDVTYYTNISANNMKALCQKMAERDHSDSDCFVCVIMSHGEDGIVLGRDEPVEIKELTDHFKGDCCESLIGKPKLFFIQACRGTDFDSGVEIDVTDAIVMKDDDVIKLPIYADFLFAYSTVPGYYSWRNGFNGSWFIYSLCNNLRKFGKELEIQKLLVRVNRDVAQNFESFNPENKAYHRRKQVSCVVSMLTKDLFFTNK